MPRRNSFCSLVFLSPMKTSKKKFIRWIPSGKRIGIQRRESILMNKSYLTAITRRDLPRPTQWLMDKGLIRGRVLDYGCGKCYLINPMEWDSYDPNFPTSGIYPPYDTIICNYVLCVLPRAERIPVLKRIHGALSSDGKAYISVRNDRPKNGWGKSSRGTYQGRVANLPMEELYKCSGFRIYVLTTDTKLV